MHCAPRQRPASFAPSLPCPHCPRKFSTHGSRTQHLNSEHREITPPPNEEERGENHSFTYHRHPILTGESFAFHDLILELTVF